MYSISEIAKVIGSTSLLRNDAVIEHLLFDSRKMLFPKTSLFFAINGPRRSGSFFIEELYEKGVRNFVTDETVGIDITEKLSEANFPQVKNVLQALQLLVTDHRKKFDLPVIGITGSNGKTIVKEWLHQLLSNNYNIVRSPKSYNSQIGVPLSVWQMNSQHTLAIFEAGISRADEMQQLEKMIAPSIGVFTNIGEAHSEGFLNIRQKINEKLSLFVKSELLIYNADNPDINEAINTFSNNVRTDGGLKLFTWGKKESATLQIISIEKKGSFTTIIGSLQPLTSNNQSSTITIPFTDDAYIENAINCWCVLLALNVPALQIAERMQQLRPVEMRLELKKGINHCSIINDSYSADINSLTIALDFLAQQQQHPNRTLILSDILQTGKSSEALYADIASIIQQKNINRLIGIGPDIFKQKDAFKNIPHSSFFSSVADFKMHFYTLHFFNETVLLKGARVFEFEQISHLLEEKVHQTVLEINLTAITHNLKQ